MPSVRNAVKLKLKTDAPSTDDDDDVQYERKDSSAFSKYDRTKTMKTNVICTAVLAKENGYCLFADTQDPTTKTLYIKGYGSVVASFQVSSKDGAYVLKNVGRTPSDEFRDLDSLVEYCRAQVVEQSRAQRDYGIIRNLDSETVRCAVDTSANGPSTRSRASTSDYDVPRVGRETQATASRSLSNVQLAADNYRRTVERLSAGYAACDLHDDLNKLHFSQSRTDPIRRSPTVRRDLKPQKVHSKVGDCLNPTSEPVYVTDVRTKSSNERADRPVYAELNFDRRPGPLAKERADKPVYAELNFDRRPGPLAKERADKPAYAEFNFDRRPGPLAKYEREDKPSQDLNVDRFKNREKPRAVTLGDLSDIELRAQRERHAKAKVYIDGCDRDDSDKHEYEEIDDGQPTEAGPHQTYRDRRYRDPEDDEREREVFEDEQAHRPHRRSYTRSDNGHGSKTRYQNSSMMYY